MLQLHYGQATAGQKAAGSVEASSLCTWCDMLLAFPGVTDTAGQNRLLALNYIYPGEDPMVCAAHVEWGAAFQAQFAQHVLPEVTPAQRDCTPGRPLRVSVVAGVGHGL